MTSSISKPNRPNALIGFLLCGALGLVVVACGDSDEASQVSPDPTVSDSPDQAESAPESGSDSDPESAAVVVPNGDGGYTSSVVDATAAFLATLSAEQRSAVVLEQGSTDIRQTWSNRPACDNSRAGLSFGDLNDEQDAAALAVASVALTDSAFEQYEQIIAADDVLAAASDRGIWSSECYWIASYGEPSISEPWALQFGGHHYARHVAFNGSVVAVTPSFTGVEPNTFDYNGTSVRPINEQGTGIFAIFAALDQDQLAAAELPGTYSAVQLGPGADEFPTQEGLLVSELNADQQSLVIAAIDVWTSSFPPEIASAFSDSYLADLDGTTIGWSASTDSEAIGSYARIDGPSIWIELSNEAGVGTDDFHPHSLWRDKGQDYGL